ncbi:hypothetical protein Aduo_005608 [Ancylostoma duodenale]
MLTQLENWQDSLKRKKNIDESQIPKGTPDSELSCSYGTTVRAVAGKKLKNATESKQPSGGEIGPINQSAVAAIEERGYDTCKRIHTNQPSE